MGIGRLPDAGRTAVELMEARDQPLYKYKRTKNRQSVSATGRNLKQQKKGNGVIWFVRWWRPRQSGPPSAHAGVSFSTLAVERMILRSSSFRYSFTSATLSALRLAGH